MASKKVGIIGGGPSGIINLKELLDAGIEADVFEAKDKTGGLFYQCYERALLTTSMNWTAFSKFPPNMAGYDMSRPLHWTAEEYAEYCDKFIHHFGIDKNIKFSTRVDSCSYSKETSQWTIRASGKSAGTYVYDHLIIASGGNSVQDWRNLMGAPGMADFTKFEGDVMHSSHYKDTSIWKDKRVLIIGAGETAGDLGNTAAIHAKSCVFSIRSRAGQIVPRSMGDSYYTVENERKGNVFPMDLDLCEGNSGLPHNQYLANSYRQPIGCSLSTIGVKLFGDVGSLRGLTMVQGSYTTNQFGTKTYGILQAVSLGAGVKPGVQEVKAKSVVFKDGSEEEFDLIVLCTGYRAGFSYLEEAAPDIVKPKSSRTCNCPVGSTKFNPRDMWKHMVHPDWRDKIFFSGFARPAFGSIPQQSELQARFIAKLLKGEVQLPEKNQMEADILADGASEIDQHWSAKTTFPLVSFIKYTNDLAIQIGSKPDYTKYLFTEPRFLFRLLVSQYTVARFYLNDEDPEMRKLSRETIMSYRRVPLMFALDINNFFVLLLCGKLGFASVRPMTVAPPTWAELLLAWIFLPLWCALLSPCIYTYIALHLITFFHPFNWLRYYKIYVLGSPDGQLDISWCMDKLSSPRLHCFLWKPCSYVHLAFTFLVLIPSLLCTKLLLNFSGVEVASAKMDPSSWVSTTGKVEQGKDGKLKQPLLHE